MTQNGGSNGYSGEQITGYLKQIEQYDGELDTLRGEYMTACKGPRGSIKNVLATARAAGINMTALRQVVEDDRAERRRLKHVDALEPDDAEIYAAMVEALGPFADTELGSAALRKTKPAGDVTLSALTGEVLPPPGRADEANLGGVGRGT